MNDHPALSTEKYPAKEPDDTHRENPHKAFYAKYKTLRQKLLLHLRENNPSLADNLPAAVDKTQKIMNRLVFLRFCEMYGLLRPGILKERLATADKRRGRSKTSVWDCLKELFDAVNSGCDHNGTRSIHAINVGLLSADPALDALVVKDEVLLGILPMMDDDFNSGLSVNILGYIFEQSISDLEAMRVEPSAQPGNRHNRRKRDGVFYTPAFVTRHIVEQAVGGWLKEHRDRIFQGVAKRAADDLTATLLADGKAEWTPQQNPVVAANIAAWRKYGEVLEGVKILDPACGSGAFLTEAFNFLVREARRVSDELRALQGSSVDVFDHLGERILARNLYGVDISEESVEITKLVLWLNAANKDNPLAHLDNNIKCSNSIVDDPTVAGEKALDWAAEFPTIMANGGFDVVVGNPPYFNIDTFGLDSPMFGYLKEVYPAVYMDKSDILFYFIAKAVELANSGGRLGFIVSNAFLASSKAAKLRNHLVENTAIQSIVNFERHLVFKDANVTTLIFTLQKSGPSCTTQALVFKDADCEEDDLAAAMKDSTLYHSVTLAKDAPFVLAHHAIVALCSKLDLRGEKLGSLLKVGQGMQTAANDVFLFKDWPASFPTQFMKMRIDGEMIQRYHTSEPTECVLYVEDAVDFSSLPASVQAYLESNRGKLEKRAEKRRRASKWWTFTFPLHKELYHLDKIWCSYRAKRNAFTLDDTNRHVGLTNTTVIFGTNPDYDLRYILALLNSKALDFRYKTIGKQTGSGVYEYLGNQVSQLPIPRLPRDAQQPFIALVETLIAENRNYHAKRVEFLTLLRRDFPTLKTTALSEWWNREWPEVKDALARQRVHFRDTIAEEDWVRRFNRYSGDLRAIQSSLRDVDARLDALVCQLYQLTPTEIAIMEEETTNPNA